MAWTSSDDLKFHPALPRSGSILLHFSQASPQHVQTAHCAGIHPRRFRLRRAHRHAQTAYAPCHVLMQSPPPNPRSAAVLLQWFSHSGRLLRCGTISSGSGLLSVSGKPASYFSDAETPYSVKYGHGRAEKQAGYHIVLPPALSLLCSRSRLRTGLASPAPFSLFLLELTCKHLLIFTMPLS